MKAEKTFVTVQRPVTEEVITITMTVRQAQLLKQFIGRVENEYFMKSVNESSLKAGIGITLNTQDMFPSFENPDLVNHRLFEALSGALRK